MHWFIVLALSVLSLTYPEGYDLVYPVQDVIEITGPLYLGDERVAGLAYMLEGRIEVDLDGIYEYIDPADDPGAFAICTLVHEAAHLAYGPGHVYPLLYNFACLYNLGSPLASLVFDWLMEAMYLEGYTGVE